MPLTSGAALGPYEIVSLIGEGGMGEVYRARDTRLGRTVALKISKEKFSERFAREARAIAALNHPHICTLYDVGPSYLVIEYLEGETLDARLKKGPLPIDKALPIAIQIAEALAAAHRKNIVHRDLKPANIMLTKSGPKLLDFGLAKNSATLDAGMTAAATQEGLIAGTIQYMSPEQLEGKEVDGRTDIFAFGCVLYEMMTGKPAFTGDSAASLIGAIMTAEPAPLAAVAPATPAAIDRVVRRCLAKDPDARWQCAGDLAAELQSIAAAPLEPAATAQPVPTRRLSPLLAIPVLAGLLVVIFGVWWWPRQQAAERWSGVLLGGPSMAIAPRVSPDGRLVAFAALVDGITQVAVMKPETGNWTVLTHARDVGLVDSVAWSPDGSRIYFDRVWDSPHGIYSVPLFGGEPRQVLDAAADPEPLPDGSLIVLRINADHQVQLHHFWPDSGRLEPLAAALMQYEVGGCVRPFPDGKEVAFYGRPLAGGDPHLYALDLATNKIRKLAPGLELRRVMGPRFPVAVTRDGRSVIIDVMAGSLHRITTVPRDGRAGESLLLTTTATPWNIDASADGSLYMDQMDRPVDILRFPVTGGVPERISGSFHEGMRGIVPLPNGGVVAPGPAGARESLLLVEPGQDSTPLLETADQTQPPVALGGPDQVVLTLRTAAGLEIGVASVSARRLVKRVRIPEESIQSVALSADGKEAYYAAAGNIFAIAFDGGKPRTVCPGDSLAMYPGGQEMLVQLVDKDGTRLERVSLKGGPTVKVPARIAVSGEPLAPNAVGPDGRIALSLAASDSWFYPPGVLDTSTGAVTRIPVLQTADYFVVGWGGDGRLVAMAMEARCAIWRFLPK
ncbi:MAG TPA: protein kinase [Bryobacteraceae bacterium]|nr:protein kinase [Bryobacteraceae bacterium]